jgi:putative oxidoreductase
MERDVVPSSRDLGVLLVRLGVGATLAAHGGQKVFGWFDGPGLEATAAGFDAMGFRPGKANALAAGVSEIGSGALLAAGLASAVHGPNGFFAQKGGYEYSAILGVTAAGIALAGPGRLSLDHATGDVLNRPWMKLVALAAIVPTSVFVVSQRNKALAAPSDAAPKPVTAPDTDRGRTP